MQFLDRHGALLAGFTLKAGGKEKDSTTATAITNGDGDDGQGGLTGAVAVTVVGGAAGFALKVLEDITAAFLQQVITPTHPHPRI